MLEYKKKKTEELAVIPVKLISSICTDFDQAPWMFLLLISEFNSSCFRGGQERTSNPVEQGLSTYLLLRFEA